MKDDFQQLYIYFVLKLGEILFFLSIGFMFSMAKKAFFNGK